MPGRRMHEVQERRITKAAHVADIHGKGGVVDGAYEDLSRQTGRQIEAEWF